MLSMEEVENSKRVGSIIYDKLLLFFKKGIKEMILAGLTIDREELKSIEYLLQFSAVQIALNDNYLNKKELDYIRSLAHEYDFCDFLKENGYPDMTWDKIFHLKEKVLIDILAETKKYFYNKIMFVDMLKHLKKLGMNDVVEIIYEDIIRFECAISNSDGDSSEIDLIVSGEKTTMTIIMEMYLVAMRNEIYESDDDDK